MTEKIVIGTRGSKLALWQANWVKHRIESSNPDITVSLDIIKTQGDKILDTPLAKIGGKGLFVKEIETALIEKRIDIAVHSMKDMPAELPKGLTVSAITKREDPSDVLISYKGVKLEDLKKDSTIGTSSLRRKILLYSVSPCFNIVDLRGNLDTRINKLKEGVFDAIVVAAAGVNRLGFSNMVTEVLNKDVFLPAVGQGVLGIETREDDERIAKIVKPFNHKKSAICVAAERAFLSRLEGGCQVPIAAYSATDSFTDSTLTIEGLVGSIDGKNIIRGKRSYTSDGPEEAGIKLAESLLKKGADKILADVYGREFF